MGYGGYSYSSASSRSMAYKTSAKSDYTYLDREVFSRRSLDKDMDIKGKIRESRDSAEHPEAFSCALFTDTTGSMGGIPKHLITQGYPELMKKIMDAGVKHLQVCFGGVGDNECDSAPIQVGEFETNDELQEKWLKSIYLEGGGGSNPGEGYALAWYTAARHMVTDSMQKRGQKGVLITIGDEPYLPKISKRDLNDLFGGAQSDITAAEAFTEASKNWDIYHINVKDYRGSRDDVQTQWKQLLGDHFVNTQTSDGTDIPDIIADIVIKCYNERGNKGQLLTEDEKPDEVEVVQPKSETEKNNEHLL